MNTLLFRNGCLLTVFSLCLLAATAHAQKQVPFDSGRWNIESQSHMITEYMGKDALYLHNGTALLNDANLENGIIEFDIAFPQIRGFTGVAWRMTDPDNYEDFYFRPHQSGYVDANQYTPVFHGVTGWQLYHGEGYGTPSRYRFNEWMHVKLVFWEDQAQVFIDDMRAPAVSIPKLKRDPASGGIGLRAFLVPTYFSGFSFRPLEEAPFERMPHLEVDPPAGVITGWEVSDPFEATRLPTSSPLEEGAFSDLGWHRMESEVTGITNLARLNGIGDGKNTVFARLTIQSDREQLKRLRFGYSDRVRVYVNGQPVYGGDNTYTSRDYRYLGTIGLFDEVYLPLREGDNEVRFAVMEAFGGWGILASMEDRSGLTLPGWADARTGERDTPGRQLAEFRLDTLGEGVYVAVPETVTHGFVEPNITIVEGDESLLVVDAGFLPSSARTVISMLKEKTRKPVRYLLNTHWHGDHHHGNRAWAEAYPGLEIIAQSEGRREIQERGMPDIDGFVDNFYPNAISSLREEMRSGDAAADEELRAQKVRMSRLQQALDEMKTVEGMVPDREFEDSLTVELGNREVRLMYFGPGNTYGDALVYVPDQRILVTGDLVVHPRPYVTSDHYEAWSNTLEKMKELPVDLIVPGHGAVMDDFTYVDNLIALFRTVTELVGLERRDGLELEQVQDRISVGTVEKELEDRFQIEPGYFNMSPAWVAYFVGRAYRQQGS